MSISPSRLEVHAGFSDCLWSGNLKFIYCDLFGKSWFPYYKHALILATLRYMVTSLLLQLRLKTHYNGVISCIITYLAFYLYLLEKKTEWENKTWISNRWSQLFFRFTLWAEIGGDLFFSIFFKASMKSRRPSIFENCSEFGVHLPICICSWQAI